MEAVVAYVRYPCGRHCGERVPLLFCEDDNTLWVGEAGSYHQQLAKAIGRDPEALAKGYLFPGEGHAGVRGAQPSEKMIEIVRRTFRVPVNASREHQRLAA